MDNKMKKVGLTALAGSLAATTGYAADMSVSGSWAVSYDTNDTSTVTGNPLTLGDSITFSASGETDQGWTVGMSYELDYGGVLDDLKATLDMGDAGKFTFGESAGGSGIRAVKNIVPAADTAVYSMSATTTAYGMARGIDQTGYIGYDISVGDVALSFDTSKAQVELIDLLLFLTQEWMVYKSLVVWQKLELHKLMHQLIWKLLVLNILWVQSL